MPIELFLCSGLVSILRRGRSIGKQGSTCRGKAHSPPLLFLCRTTPNKAYWEAEKEAVRKVEVKRNERIIKHWTRLGQGLWIRQRLNEKYSTRPGDGNGVGGDVGGSG